MVRRPLSAAALAEKAVTSGRRASRQVNRVVYRKAHESLGETVRFPSTEPVKLPRPPLPCVAALLSALLLAPAVLPAAGFTEPPIVFYGSITQSNDGYTILYTAGQIEWTITPATGPAFRVRSQLADLPGNLSYRLEIPVEKVPSGFTLSAGSLPASSSALTHTRGVVTLDGNTPLSVSFPTGPAATAFTFTENQRGKTERVDLAVVGPFLDTDGDGIPDWYEDLHGMDKYDPSDALLDRDGDGANALTEYLQHTNLDVYEFDYSRWAALRFLPATQNPPAADSDGDGIPNALEFALDLDPNKPDAALLSQRAAVTVAPDAGQQYVTMTVTKPAQKRTKLTYAVEASTDLVTWSVAEGTAVVTKVNTDQQLVVRGARPLSGSSPTRYLRLRVEVLP